MTVEIKELIIKAMISDDQSDLSESGQGTIADDREEIIEACVEQVLKILERSKER
jgi:hypothetical protein